jgi:Flp pilus assembly pilin Flp
MARLGALFLRLKTDQSGVTTAEYAVMLVLVAIAVAAFGTGISGAITGVFDDLAAKLTTAPAP